jgi:hypothetical protein
VKFVGHIIDADGIRADPDKIQAIKESILLKILAPVNCPSV